MEKITSIKTWTIALLQYWLIIFIIGSSIILGIYYLDILQLGEKLPLASLLKALAAFSLALSLLLILDKQSGSDIEAENLTFPGLIYYILVKRKSLLILLVLVTISVIYLSYYVLTSLFTVQYLGKSGMVVELPGQTVYYSIIDPYGWQNTGIELREDDVFEVEITGRVSPGFLQDIPRKQKHLDTLVGRDKSGEGLKISPPKLSFTEWGFSGPEGYTSELYSKVRNTL